MNELYGLVGVECRTMFSGWLKPMRDVDPRFACNIHPGSTQLRDGVRPYAGKGMYGHFVHEAVHRDYKAGLISHTEVTMHAVTEEYDAGGVMARFPVPLFRNDTPEKIAKRVNKMEHRWQPRVMSDWLHGKIRVSKTGRVTKTPYAR